MIGRTNAIQEFGASGKSVLPLLRLELLAAHQAFDPNQYFSGVFEFSSVYPLCVFLTSHSAEYSDQNRAHDKLQFQDV